ncbi:PLP-dependent transferase [Acaromyces ingoldii]|uniref:PLP-dependent transferase n=1 Tax=Acaromyces ingoldii TaxID=215250 RepID=A0A316YBY2_9BASI|nr:PLP-dependent transferase [Acaromyces ingoldii]PWN86759.1 PLP-dependent transferase [Acaromyces ingoldii]
MATTINPADLMTLGLKVLQQCVENRTTTSEQTAIRVAGPDDVDHLHSTAIPDREPASIDNVLARAAKIFAFRARMDHPKFFGFIPSPSSDYSWLGDMLNAAYNPHAGSWFQSSGPSSIEKSLIHWMARDLFSLPDTAGGCFVSGGSMANLIALMVARDQMLSDDSRGKALVYVSEQTHSSIGKALRILGFRGNQLRKIDCDNNSCISISNLERQIIQDRGEGGYPFLIVGNCGTTNTGSIDDFVSLAAIASAHRLWLHADGAYGASIVLSAKHKNLLRGVDLCDSMTWDAHKWLFQTYGCGIIIVRNQNLLVESFQTGAEYTRDAPDGPEECPNFWNYGQELTRPARAMKLWFSLHMIGLGALETAIDRGFELAEVAQQALSKLKYWDIVSSAKLAIVCFRYAPPHISEAKRDLLNEQISKAAIRESIGVTLTTRLHGKTVLRICSIHPDLQNADMVAIVENLDRIARGLSI